MAHVVGRLVLIVLAGWPVIATAQRPQPADTERLDRARTLARRAEYDAALALFDTVLRADPQSRDAALGRAQTLAWARRFTESVREYEQWIGAHTSDAEAKESLARTLSWAGRLHDAERLYAELAAAGSSEGEKGLARIAGWRGDLADCERRWRVLSGRYPRDSETWTGLAQALRWLGRDREAREALARALVAEPANTEVAERLRSVDAALAPRVTSSVVMTDDTDDNRTATVSVAATLVPSWNGELSNRVQLREAKLGGARGQSLGAAVHASWRMPLLSLAGSLGAAHLTGTWGGAGASMHHLLTATAAASVRAGARATLGVGVARLPFDETAPLMLNGTVTTAVTAGGTVALGHQVGFSSDVERAWLRGGTRNTRTTASGALRWEARPAFSLTLATRGFGYASNPGDGYFAPDLYTLSEGSVRLALGRERTWSATVEGGAGLQTVNAGGQSSHQPAERGTIAITYRPTSGIEWTLTGALATAASAATSQTDSYRSTALTLRGRLSF
jgi:Flp pilus assembly protein TadD